MSRTRGVYRFISPAGESRAVVEDGSLRRNISEAEYRKLNYPPSFPGLFTKEEYDASQPQIKKAGYPRSY